MVAFVNGKIVQDNTITSAASAGLADFAGGSLKSLNTTPSVDENKKIRKAVGLDGLDTVLNPKKKKGKKGTLAVQDTTNLLGE